MRSVHFRLTLALLFIAAMPDPVRAVTADLVMKLPAEGSGQGFGIGLAGDFDFNGDGFPDVAVGAPYHGGGGFQRGRVYIYLRGPGFDETADVTITGAQDDDYLGWSIASAGDVNNDGFDDILVGALDCCVNTGLAYIYLGGAVPNGTADVTMTGAGPDDLFGYAVAGLGDVNADGFDDWIVGGPQNNAGGSNSGQAYVFFGGATPNNVADLTLTGAAASDLLGWSVSGAGDVNGDGFRDMLVGAYGHDAGGASAGRAYVYYGGSSPNSVADIVVDGSEGNLLGLIVSGAGDMNGDGFDDFVAGSYGDDTGGATAGRALVYFGGAIPNAVPDLIIEGDASDSLAFALAPAGDVDGDGYDDLIVGVPGGGSGGETHVYLGGISTDATADLVIPGADVYDQMGRMVAASGDVNGDGRDDLLAASATGSGEVYAYVVQGYRLVVPNGGEQWVVGQPAAIRWSGRELTDISISSDAGATWVSLAEDVGGAAENEFAAIAPAPATDRALIRIRKSGAVLSPSTSDISDASFRIVEPHDPPAAALHLQETLTGTTLGDLFGTSAASAGDVNGDGYDDFIVGASGNDAGGTSAGRAYIYLGGPAFDTIADVTITGAVASDVLGTAVDGAGDVNGDGFDDVIVGISGSDAAFSNAGAASVYFGGVSMDAVADWTLLGLAASDNFGNSVAGAGDVNGDGYDDIFIGASGNDAGGTTAGAAYLYYGGPAPDAVADLTVLGITGDSVGFDLDGAGDVNGDGYFDLIVGAIGFDGAGSNGGAVYIFRGGPALDTTPDLVLVGEAAGDNFGFSVAGAGDANGDGFADVLIGAHLNDAGGSSAGRVYLFHGGPTADITPDMILTGIVASENFGQSVGAAGDVNGDGYADLIAGAEGNDQPAVNAGRAVLVFGGPGADATPDLEARGAASSWSLGSAVTGAGDVNGDGFADLLIGARQSSSAGPGFVQIYDGDRFAITSPGGGDVWNVGATESISWLGAEPADVWLSVDGGNSYSLLEEEVGGDLENTLARLVPHQPTRFARIRLTPSDPAVTGDADSDSLFTIEASITLLNLKAEPIDGGGVRLSWSTNPGPEDLAGYRIERSRGDEAWFVLVPLTRETTYTDAAGRPGERYRLSGVNGLGQELVLGETGLGPVAALTAWPLPYRGGEMTIAFLTAGGLGGRTAPTDVAIFDAAGRRVRTVVEGDFGPGSRTAAWDGRDDEGRPVAGGIYFLRAASGGAETRIKLAVVR